MFTSCQTEGVDKDSSLDIDSYVTVSIAMISPKVATSRRCTDCFLSTLHSVKICNEKRCTLEFVTIDCYDFETPLLVFEGLISDPGRLELGQHFNLCRPHPSGTQVLIS